VAGFGCFHTCELQVDDMLHQIEDFNIVEQILFDLSNFFFNMKVRNCLVNHKLKFCLLFRVEGMRGR
jgi:hypothetical protein